MCLFAEQVFRSTYFCCWKHIAVDSEFFVLSTLEKYHQISLSCPWSATYDLGWIKLRKIKRDSAFVFKKCFENRPYTCLQVLFFKTSNIYRPLVDARVGDSRRLLSEVFERRADYFILTTSSEKNFSLIASRKEKNTWNIVKITFSCGNYNIFTFFSCCLPETRTKDHRKRSPFCEFQAKYLCLELETSGLSTGT